MTVRRIPLTPSSSNKFIIRAVVGDVVSDASDIITVITGMGLILFKWSMCTALCRGYSITQNDLNRGRKFKKLINTTKGKCKYGKVTVVTSTHRERHVLHHWHKVGACTILHIHTSRYVHVNSSGRHP